MWADLGAAGGWWHNEVGLGGRQSLSKWQNVRQSGAGEGLEAELQRVRKKEEGSWGWKGIQVKKRQSSCCSLEVAGCGGYFQMLNTLGREAVQ